MPLSAVSVLVVAQSSSAIPEGLMNNPVFIIFLEVCVCLYAFEYEGRFNAMCGRHPVSTHSLTRNYKPLT